MKILKKNAQKSNRKYSKDMGKKSFKKEITVKKKKKKTKLSCQTHLSTERLNTAHVSVTQKGKIIRKIYNGINY